MMSLQPEVDNTKYDGSRITVTSHYPFNNVMEKFYASVGSTSKWPVDIISSGDKEAFVQAIKAARGPHDFMFFAELDQSSWIGMFGIGDGLKAKRMIVGNPLIATTTLGRDLDSGLFVPVEIFVAENPDRVSTRIVYNLLSAEIGAVNKDLQLLEAAKILDGKVEALVHYIAA